MNKYTVATRSFVTYAYFPMKLFFGQIGMKFLQLYVSLQKVPPNDTKPNTRTSCKNDEFQIFFFLELLKACRYFSQNEYLFLSRWRPDYLDLFIPINII